ncbi:hypothetical protein [Rhodococcus triatomae]
MTAVVPGGFEAYVRVLHPVVNDDERFVRWRDVAVITGRRVHPSVQWWRLIGARTRPLSSNMAWPADHAWCVGTEVDFDSTLVGCNRNAADEILSCTGLDALPINPDDSLRYDADRVNT